MTDNSDKKSTNLAEVEIASKTFDVIVSASFIAALIPVPPSAVKSVRKAFDRLICSGTDYMLTHIESATAKRKLQDEGRKTVLGEVAKAASLKASNDEDIVERAVENFTSELVAKQRNRDKIFKNAVNEIKETKFPYKPDTVIDDDWLGTFSTLTSQKSNEEVQRLLGKILAGEIRQPGTFSPLALHILSTLTPDVAKSFESICNLSFSWDNMSFINYAPYPDFLTNGLQQFGVHYGNLLEMQNYGLLFQNLQTGLSVPDPIHEKMIEIGGKQLQLKSKIEDGIKANFSSLTPLSLPGNELRKSFL